jgi:DNA-directed RNA polymerase II subunit RPB1
LARPRTSTFRRLLAGLTAMLIAVVASVIAMPTATAATPGIAIDILHNGTVLEDGATIPEGDPFTVRVQYDAAEAIDGSEITLSLPPNVSLPGSLPTNQGVESITDNGDGTYTILFKDPIPDDITEGAFAFQLQANEVDGDTETPISWTVNGETTGVTIVVENEEVPPVEIADGYGKSYTGGNLNAYVQTSGSPDYAFTGLREDVTDAVLPYTLVLDSSQLREGYTIADLLPAGLSYDADSFSATRTTYNPTETTEDYSFVPAIDATGDTESFTGTVDVPANSRLVITYTAHVSDPSVIEARLRALWEDRDDVPGNYGYNLVNTATFGGEHERTAQFGVTGNIPGVGIGNAFAKWGNRDYVEVIADEDGTLEQPYDMTYSFRADLRQWDGQNPNFTLNENVVIRDVLIDQAQWLGDEPEFLTVSGDGPIQSLVNAGDCPATSNGDVSAFSGDQFVGSFCVDGQTLLVNVGQDNTTNIVIEALAQLTTVAGLNPGGSSTVTGATSYEWPNEAQFYHGGGDYHRSWYGAHPVVLPDDREGGLHDTDAFAKNGPDGEIVVQPGESAEVPYSFRVNTNRDPIDPLLSRIVDEVDDEFFDLSDLSTIPVSGSYGSQALGADDFDLTLDDDGNLVIELSEAGKALVEAQPEGQIWTVNIVLTTVPLDGKQTFEIYNRATLYGDGTTPTYWDEDDSEATSFGDEAEIRKRVFDRNAAAWTQQLTAPIEDGEFVDDRFVYSIELIPRGNYGSDFPVQIFPRQDVLPDDVEFLGFVTVDADGVPNLTEFSDGPIDVPGNVQMSYEDGVVTFSQREGTTLDRNQGPIRGYFAVRALDTTGDIVNSIAGSDATIVPTGDPSVDIEKWNDEGETPEYDETGALLNDGFAGDFDEARGKQVDADTPLPISFTISNDGREDLVDVTVSDQLTDGVGEITDLVCTFPDGSTGTTWAGPFVIGTQFDCTGTLPALTSGDSHSDTATVTATGVESGEIVDDEDDWNGYVPVPSVDIEKWNDEGNGEAPEYDETGALLNDGFAGDFDEARGKQVDADTPLPITFTISNDGEEELVDLTVTDELTDGTGEITDLVCTFPDGSTGTTWAGPFAVGTQFDCTGTLPALTSGDSHSDTATVTATGVHSGVDVDDEDDWNGYVPVPSVDIEKWNDEGNGEAPEYDETGALLNDGYEGDFDESPGRPTALDTAQPLHFTVSNDGEEDLVYVTVSDQLTGGVGEISDLVCEFPDGSTGTSWAGPFAVGTQFDCTGTVPAFTDTGEFHADTATVVATGLHSRVDVDDEDDWYSHVPVPSVDIEKWNDEGEAPAYDLSGLLLNDGYAGDHDEAPGAALRADTEQTITFTVSNDGKEPLVDVTVTDRLTDGAGEISDLVCTFPDGSQGTTWAGPFEIGVQFDCTGTLPAPSAGDVHADTATVVATGLHSGADVDDEDDWNGYVPVPGVDIEKWNDEGEAPEYDESGALLNDGFAGDHDESAAELAADASTTITFTVSNNGAEDLIDVTVSDRLTGGTGEITDLVCTFPDGSTGTTWAGPFAVGTQFDCTGTLPALGAGATHSNEAQVSATGADSGLPVGDQDAWNGVTPDPEVPATPDPEVPATPDEEDLASTGVDGFRAYLIGALLLIVSGAGALVISRARRA